MKKTIENDYLKIEVYGCLCALNNFNIKGIAADLEDFQESHDDEDSENAEDYCCGNKVFRAKKATDEIVKWICEYIKPGTIDCDGKHYALSSPDLC